MTRSSSFSRIWPWAYSTRALGHQGLDLLRHVLDGLDLVVQEVDLAAAGDLALAGLLDQASFQAETKVLIGQALGRAAWR
jgi:hypothetical protein